MRRRDPTHDAVVLAAPREIEIGGGQHGHGDAGIGEAPRDRREARSGYRREPSHMADGDAPAQPMLLGRGADIFDMHLIG